jgi:predicted TIM-barrel fold metal-dependent hydrolase
MSIETKSLLSQLRVFDSHLHIVDPKFPLVRNDGYVPEQFTCEDYLSRTANFKSQGGAVVSGSFQAFDQSYLESALRSLGPTFVGVTQLPTSVSDAEILRLNGLGVRALRFNLKRGGSEEIEHLASMARRVYDLAKWHVELYADSSKLSDMYETLVTLPSVSIDHLGLSRSGLPTLLKLVERGVRVKATGFSRVDLDVRQTLRDICAANPQSLMFGTDLPSTRAPKPYTDEDLLLVVDSIDPDFVTAVLEKNAMELYRPNES